MKLLVALAAGLSFVAAAAMPKDPHKVAVRQTFPDVVAPKDFQEITSPPKSNAQDPPSSSSSSSSPPTNTTHALSTVTQHPKIILKSIPNHLPPSSLVILPFHLHLVDACSHARRPHHRTLTATWTNGDRILDGIPLETNGSAWSLEHKIPGYAPLTLGAWDATTDSLRFRYGDCSWSDQETWRECGECRAGLWSGDAPDCRGGGVRTKDMDCSVILGVRAKE